MSDDTNLPTIPRLDGRSPAQAAEPPFQFSLRHLLILTAAIAVPIALVSQLGAMGVVLSLLFASVLVMCFGVYNGNGWFLAGMIAFVVLFSQVLMPVVSPGRGPGTRIICSGNLKQIGIALYNYHDTYGSYPPAYIADANGRPMHSWRVLILPFMEEQRLYDQYHFDEPWDGPNNRLLAQHIPRVYRCPTDPDTKPPSGTTSYLAVVGPETAWPGENAVSMAKIKDGTSNTVLVVESHNTGIHWMEPRDLHTTQMSLSICPTEGQGICSLHGSKREQAQVVFTDCSVRVLTDDTPAATVRALLTIAGGEEVELP